MISDILKYNKNLKQSLYLYICIAVLLVSGLGSLLILHPYHALGGDFSLYISQAKAILEGTSEALFEVNRYSMNSSDIILGPDFYPPGYPLILSIIYYFSGLNFRLLKLPGIFFFLLTIFILFKYLRPLDLTYSLKLLILFLFAFNPFIISGSHHIIADIPFTCLCLGFMFQLSYHYRLKRPITTYLSIGIVLSAACLIRTAGLILIPTLIGYHLCIIWRKRPSIIITEALTPPIFVLIPVIITFFLSRLLYPSVGGAYLDYFSFIQPDTIMRHIQYYSRIIFLYAGNAGWIIYAISLPLISYGIYMSGRSFIPELIFCVLYISMLIIWPFTDGLRFLFPVFPFLFLFFAVGLRDLAYSLGSGKHLYFLNKGIQYLLLPAIISVFLYFLCRNVNDNFEFTFGNKPSREMFAFIEKYTSVNEHIVFSKPRVMYLFTGRTCIALSDPETIQSYPASFYVHLRISDPPTSLTEVYRNKEYIIYRLIK